jgi:hypothetical protein
VYEWSLASFSGLLHTVWAFSLADLVRDWVSGIADSAPVPEYSCAQMHALAAAGGAA